MRTQQKANPRSGRLQKVLELLGGARILSQTIAGPLDVHDLLHHGLPASALGHLVGKLVYIQKAGSLKKAIGMSLYYAPTSVRRGTLPNLSVESKAVESGSLRKSYRKRLTSLALTRKPNYGLIARQSGSTGIVPSIFCLRQ